MKRPGCGWLWASAIIVVTCCGWAVTATAQQASLTSVAVAKAGPALDDSLRDLQSQVRELNATVTELLGEMNRSRREAQELRREVQAEREEVASFKRELAEARQQAAAAAGAPADSAGIKNDPFEESTQAESLQPGQTSLSDRVSALDRRVGTLADDQQLLGAKVEDQYQTKVESGSKYRVRLSGIALLNIFGTRGSVDNLDLPMLARHPGPLDSSGSFGGTLRQSLVGLEVFGPALGGAKTSGDIQFDFFGGYPNTPDGVTAGLVRLRTARISLDWGHTSIVGGQDAPFFSPLSPSSLASLAYPALSAAGNLWVWTPQLRVEHRAALSESSTMVLQGGILDALTGEPPGYTYNRVSQAGERAHAPAYAARTAWTRAAFGHSLTVGAGAYYARQDWSLGRLLNAWAATADWDLPLGPWFSLSGEFYRGQAIGGLGAGGSRSVLFNGPAASPTTAVLGLNSEGGWAQLKFKPIERMEFNGVFGEDYPFASDLRRFRYSQSYLDASLGRNASGYVNVIYHARSNLLLSLEYRRLWTTETSGFKYTADHVNFGAGILF